MPVEWPEYDLHLIKGSTSASSSEVNMAEATPITEESIINRSSSHQIVHIYRLRTFIWKQMTVLPRVKQLSRDCTVPRSIFYGLIVMETNLFHWSVI